MGYSFRMKSTGLAPGGGAGESAGKPKRKKRLFTEFGVVMLVVLGLALAMFFTVKPVVVSGLSMFPTLKDREKVLTTSAYWLVGPLRHDDIVVVRDDSPQNKDGFFIKRIYKLAGEEVDYANWPRGYSLAEHDKFVVPEGTVFLLGDNRPKSEDSRAFGPVPLNKIIGKVIKLR